VFKRRFTATVFVEFLNRLVRQVGGLFGGAFHFRLCSFTTEAARPMPSGTLVAGALTTPYDADGMIPCRATNQ
jgi:hypothetical protein